MAKRDTVGIHLWHFRCDECGFGDAECNHQMTTELIWCEVCLEEGRHVRLRRWPVENSGFLPLRRSAT